MADYVSWAGGECPATLKHAHGTGQCRLTLAEHDTPGHPWFDARKPGQHSTMCEGCWEDGEGEPLCWTDPTNGHTTWGG